VVTCTCVAVCTTKSRVVYLPAEGPSIKAQAAAAMVLINIIVPFSSYYVRTTDYGAEDGGGGVFSNRSLDVPLCFEG
jgi:Na+-translocating ferredoxin:NAD+ oxidoreductase RnfD subunit